MNDGTIRPRPKKYIYKNKTMKKILLILAIIATTASAQEITYREYMRRVLTDNIALTARSLDIEIADAQVKSSRTYNDPTLAVTYTNN